MYINPYDSMKKGAGQWLKGNFHTHAGTGEGTCGAYAVDDVFALYKEAGYQVLTISNHDLFTDTEEYALRHGMVMLNGFEYSRDPHMLCINVKDCFIKTHQETIDECKRQGGFVILNHPNWQRKEYWAWKGMDTLSGYTGIEIYNGVIFRLSGSGLATNTWDYLLSQGKIVWGFANDDFHRWYDLARAWNLIYSPSLTKEDVQGAMQRGCFYASTGLILNEFGFTGGILRISARAKDTYVKVYKYRFIGRDGQVLCEQDNEYGEYRFIGDELYVRVQVVSEHGAMLWTQPVYKSDLFRKP